MLQDVVIIGGGMAGYSLAVALGRQGLRVTVIERERAFPRLIKGELIQVFGVLMAEELGILPLLLQARGQKISRYRRSVYQYEMRYQLDEREPGEVFALSIQQDSYLGALLNAANATPGVTVRRGVRATGLLREGDTVRGVLMLEESGREAKTEARLVVGADGRNSQTRKWLGISSQTTPGRFAVGGTIAYQGPPEELTMAQIASGEAVIGVPLSDRTMRIGLLFGQEGLAEIQANPREAWERRLSLLPCLAETAWSLLPDEPIYRCDCPELICDRVVANGAVLAGDAAGVLDPITGFGLQVALHDAWLLGDMIPRWLSAGDLSETALMPYQQQRQDLFLRCMAYTRQQKQDILYASGLQLRLVGQILRRLDQNQSFRDYMRPEIFGQPRPTTPGHMLRQLLGWPLPGGAPVKVRDLQQQYVPS